MVLGPAGRECTAWLRVGTVFLENEGNIVSYLPKWGKLFLYHVAILNKNMHVTAQSWVFEIQ